ncbi:hypothetical protein RDWZM_008253 [Blomia tropicalis]|uniref:Uncharacterized protein n=1 Tax=Blomia tropicalis TaxID=40697 RepID=A0A9Q0M132_BLOTA|nr:hypothetical protein RDWZM_008253 [Blomia tropicalis]
MATQDVNNNNISNSTNIDMSSSYPSPNRNGAPPPPPQSSPSSNNGHRRLSSSSRTNNRTISSILGSSNLSDFLFYDANTFKQVKRLYCGMLMVAMAYSVTMIIMMVVLYKTLPTSIQSLQTTTHLMSPINSAVSADSSDISKLSYRPFDIDSVTTSLMQDAFQNGTLRPSTSINGKVATSANTNAVSMGGVFRHDGRMVNHETARTYLDQVIAINFLTLILYSLAFYAAQRELYTLTLAFTSTLSFTMMFSVVKIFVEGVHFPNNFMSLLLRVSIVFVAMVYLGQLRRKQHFIRNLWLSPDSFLNHPALRSSQITPNQTAQLIRDFLTNSNGNSNISVVEQSAGNKDDNDRTNEYQDLPPNYDEALKCSSPAGPSIPLRTITQSMTSLSSRVSQQTMASPPPSFEEIVTVNSLTSSPNNGSHRDTPCQSTTSMNSNLPSTSKGEDLTV